VTNSRAIEGWRPTDDQLLLLRAALFDGDDALAAWRAWSAHVDIEHLDAGSNRMLPLLSYNLDRLGVSDPLSARLRGYRRQTWYKNQIWLSEMARFLAVLQGAGLETLVLKGTALVLLFYPDFGLRPMTDLDVLVRREQACAAMLLLAELGWKANDDEMERRVRSADRAMRANSSDDLASARMTSAALERRVRQGHATDFVNSAKLQLDLHWYVLSENRGPDADDDFWTDAVPVRIGNFTTKALSPTDTLVHVCVHGAKWCPVPPMRWVADAIMILRVAGDRIDWDRLLRPRGRSIREILRGGSHGRRASTLGAGSRSAGRRRERTSPPSAVSRASRAVRDRPDRTRIRKTTRPVGSRPRDDPRRHRKPPVPPGHRAGFREIPRRLRTAARRA